MFGISDPGIWLAYLLALVCLFYSIWFGITHWNKDDEESTNHNSRKNEHTDFRYRSNYLYVHPGLAGIYRIQTNEKC